ncbi:MAG: cysteine synthase A [Thermoguttaceae bacterium]|nr:cysteine synthase A [Thermoguttaceae bacterium]
MARRYFDNIIETIGSTPLVKINKLNQGKANVFAKVEFFNPGGSVKDRVGAAMIEAAEAAGLIQPGATIIEPTSGNTGIGLALVAAVKGYKLILTMPETMSVERRKLAAAYGAQIELTPGAEGMKGAIRRAEELHATIPGSWIPMQFENPANPHRHYEETGEEIWVALEGRVDAFVAGVGTGGTVSGVGKYLKEHNPNVHIVAVEPDTSAVLSGKPAGAHKIQGIGAGFIPKTYDANSIDEVFPVSSEDAGVAARASARQEGILVGISSGAALHVALELSKRPEFEGKNIVALLPDTGERYLSTWLFDD